MEPAYTPTQGQYLALIYYYTKIHGVPPAEADLQRHFQISPPAIHQMIVTLGKRGSSSGCRAKRAPLRCGWRERSCLTGSSRRAANPRTARSHPARPGVWQGPVRDRLFRSTRGTVHRVTFNEISFPEGERRVFEVVDESG